MIRYDIDEKKALLEMLECSRTCLDIILLLSYNIKTQSHALPQPPEEKNVNIKYFISLSGNRIENLSRLHLHSSPLRHDWPHLDYLSINV